MPYSTVASISTHLLLAFPSSPPFHLHLPRPSLSDHQQPSFLPTLHAWNRHTLLLYSTLYPLSLTTPPLLPPLPPDTTDTQEQTLLALAELDPTRSTTFPLTPGPSPDARTTPPSPEALLHSLPVKPKPVTLLALPTPLLLSPPVHSAPLTASVAWPSVQAPLLPATTMSLPSTAPTPSPPLASHASGCSQPVPKLSAQHSATAPAVSTHAPSLAPSTPTSA